jgi:hypothetical protein
MKQRERQVRKALLAAARDQRAELALMREADKLGIERPAGFHSNRVIRARNGGVRHQFEGSIGGCSANYR